MRQPDGYHLAELNIGLLRHDIGDPRVAEFIDNIDRINALGKRMPGFVAMAETEGSAGNTGTFINGNPRLVPNLTVWEDVHSLKSFVWNTVHKKFYDRRADWFAKIEMHFVMWWVPIGHMPSLEEGLKRLDTRREHGDSENAFGWDYLNSAHMHERQTQQEELT
ncbi:MAG: DUF3291 domain-containing protein [Pseudomonadota bacterium]